MSSKDRFEAWWTGRDLPEAMKCAFFMVWKAAEDAAPVASLISTEQQILGGVTSTLAKNEPESAETRMDTGVTRDVNRDELREAMQGLIDFCHDAGYDCQRAIKALATPTPAVIARPAEQPQEVHQWRRRITGAAWFDADKETAYKRVDATYEARTLYTAPLFAAPVSQHEANAVAMLSGALNHARDALRFYAEQQHFHTHQPDEWDTVSGEPPNFYEDSNNTATVEDGSVAKRALNDIAGVEAYARAAQVPAGTAGDTNQNVSDLASLPVAAETGPNGTVWTKDDEHRLDVALSNTFGTPMPPPVAAEMRPDLAKRLREYAKGAAFNAASDLMLEAAEVVERLLAPTHHQEKRNEA